MAAVSSSAGGHLGLGAERRWALGGAALAGGGLGAERRWGRTAERHWVWQSGAGRRPLQTWRSGTGRSGRALGGVRGGEAGQCNWGLGRWIKMDGGLCRGNPFVVGLGRFVGLGWAGVVHVGL
jgi:hypothetical protein